MTKIKDGPVSYFIHKDMKDMGFQFTIVAFLKILLQELEKLTVIFF